MSLAKKLAPLALAFSTAVSSMVAPSTSFANPSSNDNANQPLSFTCDMPDLSSLSLQDRIDNLMPATVLINLPGSIGSGVIVDRSGYIVTNAHVTGRAETLDVVLYDPYALDNRGTTVRGTVLGTDPWMDLAVIKIDVESSLPCVNFGDSDRVRVGDDVIAIGNPQGQTFSVSRGTVSSKNRVAHNLYNSIQSDTAVNPGNSGGGLFNTAGELIGINDRILSPTRAYAGISLAIPSNHVTEVVDEIIRYGEPRRAELQIAIDLVSPQDAARLNAAQNTGVIIRAVEPGSHAANLGLLVNDIVLNIDGKAINHPLELIRTVSSYEPEDSARFQILRDGIVRTLDLAFQPAPGQEDNRLAEAAPLAPEGP